MATWQSFKGALFADKPFLNYRGHNSIGSKYLRMYKGGVAKRACIEVSKFQIPLANIEQLRTTLAPILNMDFLELL